MRGPLRWRVKRSLQRTILTLGCHHPREGGDPGNAAMTRIFLDSRLRRSDDLSMYGATLQNNIYNFSICRAYCFAVSRTNARCSSSMRAKFFIINIAR